MERWRWHRAAKIYGERLGPHLVEDYGGEPPYTLGQIDTAVEKLGLDPRYVALGYAAFVSADDYESLRARQPRMLERELARVIFQRYRPWSPAPSDAFEDPAGFSGIARPYH